jgi:hypothetical protein
MLLSSRLGKMRRSDLCACVRVSLSAMGAAMMALNDVAFLESRFRICSTSAMI